MMMKHYGNYDIFSFQYVPVIYVMLIYVFLAFSINLSSGESAAMI